jgi:polyisoprenoid-binding protein YceI
MRLECFSKKLLVSILLKNALKNIFLSRLTHKLCAKNAQSNLRSALDKISCHYLSALIILFCIIFSLPASAQEKNFYAPDGNVSAMVIFEQAGFSRSYGLFTSALAGMLFDEQVKSIDNLKFAINLTSFVPNKPQLRSDLLRLPSPKADEIAFIQSGRVTFEDNKATIKGQLIVGNIRKDITFEATLNKIGRINSTDDIFNDGTRAVGISLHAPIKRSEYGLNNNDKSAVNDEVILLVDIIAQQ